MKTFSSMRRVAVALGTALALVAISVGQAIASGGTGPFPK
jgi:hypothetical protein